MSVEFRRATVDDVRTLTETRQKVWATTYRGIYPDEMIDQYDFDCHAARDALQTLKRHADAQNIDFPMPEDERAFRMYIIDYGREVLFR